MVRAVLAADRERARDLFIEQGYTVEAVAKFFDLPVRDMWAVLGRDARQLRQQRATPRREGPVPGTRPAIEDTTSFPQEDNPHLISALSPEDRIRARQLYAEEGVGLAAIATFYNVSVHDVRLIVRGLRPIHKRHRDLPRTQIGRMMYVDDGKLLRDIMRDSPEDEGIPV